MSLVIFSFITVVSSIVLPFGLLSPDNKTDTNRTSFTPRPPRGVTRALKKISFVRPDLQTAWMISHMMFAAAMFFAPFARSVRFATFLVAMCGIPWAVSSWAPFAFMGVEINRIASPGTTSSSTSTRASAVTMITGNRHGTYLPVDANDGIEFDDHSSVLRLNHRHDGDDTDFESDSEDNGDTARGELAGIYLGVLNVYTTLPQFLGTFISWIVFSILEPDRKAPAEGEKDGAQWMDLNPEGPNAIGVCLFIGALSAMVAIEATRRMKRIIR